MKLKIKQNTLRPAVGSPCRYALLSGSSLYVDLSEIIQIIKKTFVFSCLALMILSSCQSDQNEPADKRVFIDLDEAKASGSSSLDSEIDRIEFFQIDSREPIDKLQDIQQVGDSIVFQHRGGKYWNKALGIICIDSRGNILWNYHAVGKGPGEFQTMLFVSYLPYSEQIAFFDSGTGQIKLLDLTGKFVRSIKVDYSLWALKEINKNIWVVNPSKRSSSQTVFKPDEYDFDLVFLDPNGHEINRFLPQQHAVGGWFWLGQILLQNNSEIVYTNSLQYTLFKIRPEGVDSTWNLDFGTYNADTASLLYAQDPYDDAMEDGENQSVPGFKVLLSSEDVWVIIPRKDEDLVTAIFNQKNNRVSYYIHPEDGIAYFHGIPINMENLYQGETCFIYAMSPIDALEAWDKLSEDEKNISDPEWAGFVTSLDPESNPIILKMFLK